MNAQDQDKRFFKTFGVVMAILGGIAVISFVIAYIVHAVAGYQGLRPEQVMLVQKRTDPVYRVITDASAVQNVAMTAATGGAARQTTKSGEEVFKALCHTCHVPGLMGAPQVSNTAEWQQRLAKRGIKTLYNHAIHGFNAMPPRGGNPNLSNKEVKAAVDYMLSRAGVK